MKLGSETTYDWEVSERYHKSCVLISDLADYRTVNVEVKSMTNGPRSPTNSEHTG